MKCQLWYFGLRPIAKAMDKPPKPKIAHASNLSRSQKWNRSHCVASLASLQVTNVTKRRQRNRRAEILIAKGERMLVSK